MSKTPPPALRPFDWGGKDAAGRPNIAKGRAIEACINGQADADQQKLAMKTIIEDVCGAYDLSFNVGYDGDRLTAFAEGKRYVASQIVKTTRINYTALMEVTEHGDQGPTARAGRGAKRTG